MLWLWTISRPGFLPCTGAKSNRPSASTSLPTFLQPQEQPLWAKPNPRRPSGRGWLVSSPSHPCSSRQSRPQSSPQASVACLGQQSLLSCAPGSQLSLQACNLILPLPSPIDVPHGCQCLGCSIQQPAREGRLPLPTILGLLVRNVPLPQDHSPSSTGKECACECMQ